VAVGEGLLAGSGLVVGDDCCSCRFGQATIQGPRSAYVGGGVKILVGSGCRAEELGCVLFELR
jgi:hypothetical protein